MPLAASSLPDRLLASGAVGAGVALGAVEEPRPLPRAAALVSVCAAVAAVAFLAGSALAVVAAGPVVGARAAVALALAAAVVSALPEGALAVVVGGDAAGAEAQAVEPAATAQGDVYAGPS